MSAALRRRLDRIDGNAGKVVRFLWVWVEDGETLDQATKRELKARDDGLIPDCVHEAVQPHAPGKAEMYEATMSELHQLLDDIDRKGGGE